MSFTAQCRRLIINKMTFKLHPSFTRCLRKYCTHTSVKTYKRDQEILKIIML